jgi:hypothetical protein
LPTVRCRKKPAIRRDARRRRQTTGTWPRPVRLRQHSAAFPQFSTTYSQPPQGQKKICPPSSAIRPECEQPLSPSPRPHEGLLLPKGWAERVPLWISRRPLARLPIPSLNRRAADGRHAAGGNTIRWRRKKASSAAIFQ